MSVKPSTLNKVGLEMKWITVKFFANSKIMKLTILIPIFGYLILFNEHLLLYFNLSDTFVTNAATENENINIFLQIFDYVFNSTEFRLYSYYFGLSSLGFGSLIYIVRCPRRIKEYDSHIALINDNLNSLEPYTLKSFVNEMKKKKYIDDKYFDAVLRELPKLEKKYLASDDFEFKVFMRSVLRDLWTAENEIWQTAIISSLWFFVIGFIILSIPTITTLSNVLINMFK